MAVIYALLDVDRQIRYVGETTRHPVYRAWEHWGNAHYRYPRHNNEKLHDWLRTLDRAPEVLILEDVDDGQRLKAERRWIDKIRSEGAPLLNQSTAHHMTRHSEESKAKMSASRTGKKLTPEHKANIGAGLRRYHDAES